MRLIGVAVVLARRLQDGYDEKHAGFLEDEDGYAGGLLQSGRRTLVRMGGGAAQA
jgi:hypothetical protein